MNPQISFITLGVKDLDLLTRFYRDTLGWQMEKEQEGVRFFKMGNTAGPGQASSLIFALFGDKDLANDIGISLEPAAGGFKRVAFAINFDSVTAVDAYFAALKQKGVAIQKAPAPVSVP